MRWRFTYAASVLLASALAPVASAAPPEVQPTLPAKVGEIATFDVKLDQGKPFAWTAGFDKAKCQVVRLHSDDPAVASYMVIPREPGDYYFSFITVGEKSFTQLVVKAVGVVPPVPPIPPVPPVPPVPPPGPVTSFRVIFVYETSKPITPAMQQVMFGEKVRTYLDAKTNKGAGGNGWRKFDPDVTAANERDAALKGIWTTARPAVTVVPCVMIEVNTHTEIVNFPANEDDALAIFKKYRGE